MTAKRVKQVAAFLLVSTVALLAVAAVVNVVNARREAARRECITNALKAEGPKLIGTLWSDEPAGIYLRSLHSTEVCLISPRGNSPTISPDRTRIAYIDSIFLRNNVGSIDNVFTVDLYGENREQITRYSSRYAELKWPVWSPDGRFLALLYSIGGSGAHVEILDMDADDGISSPHFPYDIGITNYSTHVYWSLDGTRMAFTSDDRAIYEYDLYVIDFARKHVRFVSERTGRVLWSPDGKYVAFGSYDAGFGVHLIDADRLTDGVLDNHEMVYMTEGVLRGWTGHGSALYISRDISFDKSSSIYRDTALFIFDLESREVRLLVSDVSPMVSYAIFE